MKFKLGDTDIPFVFRGDELMYPNYVKDGLVLHYDFSGMTNADTSRGIAEDLSGNGNHGTLQNFNYSAESGYDKNKLLFDGVDDYITTQLIDVKALYSTYEAVITWSGEVEGNSYQSIFESSSHWNDSFFYSGETLRAYIQNGIGHNLQVETPLGLNHLARVTDIQNGKMKIYINGELKSSVDISGQDRATSTAPISISNNNRTLHENLFSTKIYNRPLTPEEIAHNYAIEKERFGIE